MKPSNWVLPRRGNDNSPFSGQPDASLFEIWRGWLADLGGKYEPMRNLEEKKPPTGRRDPDRKPRQYELPADKYAITSKGTVVRLEYGG